MECRLCLCSAPSESSVSIHDDPHPLIQRIRKCCQMPVEKGDTLPDTICLSCVKNLELFYTFRNVCIQSNEIAKLRLVERAKIKTEEVLLEDLTWKDEMGMNSPSNAYGSVVNDEKNERESKTFRRSGSEQYIRLIENKRKGKVILCGYSAEMVHDTETPHPAQSGLVHQNNIQNISNHIESRSRVKPYEYHSLKNVILLAT
ncbi:uncharacterized protein LOC143912227 isoform X3 [Arctopsyche grandis]|uniref:uncharacterized protein LOC143912227 isoform X3 n=1 Tax=Arctopsyche grandis TaxID=121162 RepID=UPI00406D9A4B